MQIVFIGDNLHEMSNAVSWESKKNISKCRLLKILRRLLSVNELNRFVSQYFLQELFNQHAYSFWHSTAHFCDSVIHG